VTGDDDGFRPEGFGAGIDNQTNSQQRPVVIVHVITMVVVTSSDGGYGQQGGGYGQQGGYRPLVITITAAAGDGENQAAFRLSSSLQQ
jgi:hypothetical protein